MNEQAPQTGQYRQSWNEKVRERFIKKKNTQKNHCSLVMKESEEELKSEVFTFKLDFAEDFKIN